jgi:hypothetical protein
MSSNSLRILRLLTTVPVLGLVTHGLVLAQLGVSLSPRQHTPMKFHGLRPDGSTDSTNWSGYAVTGSAFTQAKASWIVPTADCSATPNTYAAFWVGLDGYSSSTVEQTGTDSDCDGKSPSYYAWYEFYPNPSEVISSVPVSPGNIMSASVSYSGSEFTVTITNESTGKSYTKSAKVSGAKRSSAEWIAEAPCCTNSGGILPLADFGTVSFGLDYTGLSGTNYATDGSSGGSIPISGFSTVEPITMVSSKGVDEAVPAPLTADGTSFTVTWKSK